MPTDAIAQPIFLYIFRAKNPLHAVFIFTPRCLLVYRVLRRDSRSLRGTRIWRHSIGGNYVSIGTLLQQERSTVRFQYLLRTLRLTGELQTFTGFCKNARPKIRCTFPSLGGERPREPPDRLDILVAR
jgi:hypothetical protein